MRWSVALVLWAEGVYKYPGCYLLKLISLCFLLPIFVSHQLLFNFLFNLGSLLHLALHCHHLGLKFKDCGLEVDDYLVDFGVFRDVSYRFGQIKRMTSSGDGGGNFGDGHGMEIRGEDSD